MSLTINSVTRRPSILASVHCESTSLKTNIFSGSIIPNRKLSTTTVCLCEKPHDHAKLWIVEKATSAILVGFIPISLILPNKLFDSILAILITAHSYWGFEAIMVEYVRVILFGTTIPKIAMGFVYFITVLLLGGLFYLIFNDIGLSRAFWRIWRNMRKPKSTGTAGATPAC